jgi:hypothetical protein
MRLLLWSPTFVDSSSPLVTAPASMNVAGYLSTARPDATARVLMRRQNCPQSTPCLEIWAPNSAVPANPCNAFWTWNIPGDHINGAVWSDGRIAFLTTGPSAPGTFDLNLLADVPPSTIPNNCGPMPQVGPTLAVGAQFDSPATPSLLDVDPLTSELWWTTYGAGGCVFRWQPPKTLMGPPAQLDCAVSVATDDAFDVGFAKWTQSGLVLSSSSSALPLRFIARSRLCPACAPVVVTPADEITFATGATVFPPFDTDRDFVFGVGEGATQVVAVAMSNASSEGVLRGAVPIERGDVVRAVEGSECDQLFFSTSRPAEQDLSLKHALHRWRKPGCSAVAPACGDGCLDPRGGVRRRQQRQRRRL